MKTLVLATQNPAKFERYGKFISRLEGVDLKSLGEYKDLDKVEEPFETAQENAVYKAKQYAKQLGENVLAVDEAVFMDFLADDEQPGVHPRRVLDRVTEESDEVIYDYWVDKLKSIGGTPGGYWLYAFAICTKDGIVYTGETKSDFVFDSTCKTYPVGYPMSALSKHKAVGKVWAEMNAEERLLWDEEVLPPLKSLIEKFLIV